jgi:hypothetical protein
MARLPRRSRSPRLALHWGDRGGRERRRLRTSAPRRTGDTEITGGHRLLNGVAATEACPFFPNHYTGICPRIPARERVTRASRHSIRFEDPPRVKGNGYPSGGSLPANGALIARPQTNTTPYATDIATCTLPQSQQPLCTAILNDFLTRYRL